MNQVWIAAAVVAAVLVALATAPFIYAPGALSSTEPPIDEGLLLTQRVIRTVNVPLAQFYAWLDAAPLQEIVPGASMIPAVIGTEPVSGVWGRPGAVRRVQLADGTSALESIVENRPPEYFSYKVWPQSGAGRRLLRYIQGEFNLSTMEGDRTRVEWRYAMRPRSFISTLHALLFSQFAIRPFLDAGIDRIKSVAEEAVPRPAD